MSASRCWWPGWRAPLRGAGCGCGRSSRRTCRTTPRSPPTAARSAGPRRCRRGPAAAPLTDMNPVLLKPQSEGGRRSLSAAGCGAAPSARGISPAGAEPAAAGAGRLWPARGGRRSGPRRRRGQPGGNQPAPRRHRQYGLCRGGRRAGRAGRRHRARRRHRPARRHLCAVVATERALLAGYIVNKFRGDAGSSTAASPPSGSAPRCPRSGSCRSFRRRHGCRPKIAALAPEIPLLPEDRARLSSNRDRPIGAATAACASPFR